MSRDRQAGPVARFLSSPETLRKVYRITRHVCAVSFGILEWQDAAHATVVKVLKHAKSFRGTSEKQFISWYVTILRNSLIDHFRKHGRREIQLTDAMLDELLAPSEPAHKKLIEEAEFRRKRSQVSQSLEDLPPRQQTVIKLRYLFNCSTSEVAQLLEISPEAVRAAVFKGIKALRKAILKTDDQQST